MGKIMTKLVLVTLVAAGPLTTASFAAEPAAPRQFGTVCKLASINTRDANQRPLRFTDTSSREFAVTYDDQQRVRSVEATRGAHVTDIISIGYTQDGKVTGVRFRTGYALYLDRRPDGLKVIRDSRGGAVMRTSAASQGVEGAPVEQSNSLATTVTDLEVLMTALGQPMR